MNEHSAELLTRWVAHKHRGQVIRKTGEPYFTHLTIVAEMAGPITFLGYEVGLCYNLLEDTPVTDSELFEALVSFNYDDTEANYVTTCVVELTDVFTSAAYPQFNKETRKEKEALRLVKIVQFSSLPMPQHLRHRQPI